MLEAVRPVHSWRRRVLGVLVALALAVALQVGYAATWPGVAEASPGNNWGDGLVNRSLPALSVLKAYNRAIAEK